jgi:hypothetical protein
VLADGWHAASERPLFELKDGYWITTEDGAEPFLAAVHTNKGWWVRHCVIEDGIGLCVVGDDDNEPAGWDMGDVEYWMPLPLPPTVS